MKARELIEWSLTLKRAQKLIICRGYTAATSTASCGAMGYQVGQMLLAHCAPASSDIHDSESQHAPGRDAHGRTRAYYTHHATKSTRGSRLSDARRSRSPQLWDSERVADFGGAWCDRLLLGDHAHPVRTALLLPKVPAALEGDAVAKTAHTLRHVRACDVLLVTATPALPLGVVRLHQGQLPPELNGPEPQRASSSAPFPPLPEALTLFGGASAASKETQGFFSMWLGIADDAACRGAHSPLVGADAVLAKDLILPLASFASALWVANPTACAAYLETATATPRTLSAQTANKRLWGTMQAAMLSTRDTALLDAHFTGKTLDARLSSQQQAYFAETVLRRLDESDQDPH